jgi:hypothetical protein
MEWEKKSYGFRSKRSAHDALKQCQGYITMGYKYTVDMDLENYFDTVNHSKRAAQRTLDHIVPFIEGKLYLKKFREYCACPLFMSGIP